MSKEKRNIKDDVLPTGEHKGLMVITEDDLETKIYKGRNDEHIPIHTPKIITAYTARTGQNCKGGMSLHFDAIENCQHFNECGICVDSSRIQTSTTFKERVVGVEQKLDIKAYLAALPAHQRRAVVSTRN
jgi:hypothetical protein